MTQKSNTPKGKRRHPKPGLTVTYVRNSFPKCAKTSRRQTAVLRTMAEREDWKFIDRSPDA